MRAYIFRTWKPLLLVLAIAPGAPPIALHAGGVGISGYELESGPITIPGLNANASGTAYHAARNTLFVLSDLLEGIVELNLDGTLVRSIQLHPSFEDTEGIVHLGGDQFALTEERRRNIVIATIAADTTTVDYDASRVIHLDNVPGNDNSGLEGLAYESGSGTFFVTKEQSAQFLYRFPTPPGTLDTSVSAASLYDPVPLGLGDLAGLHYDEPSGSLLVLSDVSKTIVETTLHGSELSRLVIPVPIAKPEGITMDSTGKVYVVSEPNGLYVFARANHYESWASLQGFPAGLEAPSDDPDANGISNLLDYALGRAGGEFDPQQRMPTPSLTASELQLTFTRPKAALGLCYLVQVTDDYLSWSDGGVTLLKISETAAEETWRGTVPISGAARRALRLRVTLP